MPASGHNLILVCVWSVCNQGLEKIRRLAYQDIFCDSWGNQEEVIVMYFVNEFKRKNRRFSFSTLNNNEPNFPFLLSQVESLGNRLWDTHVGSWSEHVLRSHICFGIRGKGGRGGRGLLWCSHSRSLRPAHRELGNQGVSQHTSTVLEVAPLGLGRAGSTQRFPIAW